MTWVSLSWPVINVDDVVKSRVAAEAAGPVVQLTRKVPLARGVSGVGRTFACEVSLARSLSFTSVEALVRELWPVVNVVEVVESRAAAEAAGPVVQLTRKVPLARGDSGVGRTEVLLARSLSFTSVEALVREDSPMWLRGRSREEAVMAAEREVGVVLSHR